MSLKGIANFFPLVPKLYLGTHFWPKLGLGDLGAEAAKIWWAVPTLHRLPTLLAESGSLTAESYN
jgi:hypothetical protein